MRNQLGCPHTIIAIRKRLAVVRRLTGQARIEPFIPQAVISRSVEAVAEPSNVGLELGTSATIEAPVLLLGTFTTAQATERAPS